MAEMVKHVGRIKNTDRKCVVVFRYLYDEKGNITDKEHCLVIDLDALPDMFNQALIDTINSTEGQNTLNFFEVLARRSFSDGRNMLATMDGTGRLTKYHTNDIVMVPHPAHRISLTELNRELEKLEGVQTEEIATAKTMDTEARGEVDVELTVANNESSDTGERTPQQEAEMLRFQADRFETQAKEFRAKADAIHPDSAKPRRGRPPKEAATTAVSEASAS